MDHLNDEQRSEIAKVFWDGHIIAGRPATWSDMTDAEQRRCSAEWRAKHPVAATSDPVFTAAQAERMTSVLCAALPKLLKGFITEAVLEQRLTSAKATLDERFLEIESKFALALSDTLGAIEGSITGRAPDSKSLADLSARAGKMELDIGDIKNGLLTSQQRQLSRHAEHLQALEARIKKITRGD